MNLLRHRHRPQSGFAWPVTAVAWQIWREQRTLIVGILAMLAAAGLAHGVFRLLGLGIALPRSASYVALALGMVGAVGMFHFTEGQRRGGFGSFPVRLFWLPVRTRWLVAWPMLCAVTGVVGFYLVGSTLVFAPAGMSVPLLWPCLYLVAAVAMFQAILWSFPERRCVRLFLLSVVATALLIGWMFFLPHVLEGTLAILGYDGDPLWFQRGFSTALALVAPAAYGVSVHRLHRQRHGKAGPWRSRWGEAFGGRTVRARRPFRSSRGALMWHEGRRSGWILPVTTTVVLALTCVPSLLAGPLSASATTGILCWILIAPAALAVIVGRGLGKPDFWVAPLGLPGFQATLPWRAGCWVLARLGIALASVAVTWGIVAIGLFLWAAYAADFLGFQQLWMRYRGPHTGTARMPALLLTGLLCVLLTWRGAVAGMALGLSGRRGWYYASNVLVTGMLTGLAVLVIWQADNEDGLRLYDLWPWIEWAAPCVSLLVMGKALAAAWTWNRVHRQGLLAFREILFCLAGWIVGTSVCIAWAWCAFPHTAWVRHAMMLLALLVVPLTGPGLAMLALQSNRTRHQAGSGPA